MTEERLKNIQEKEETLNKVEGFFKEADALLERWKALEPEFKKLTDYYGSEDWLKDYEASNRGEIPEGMPHGVLSQDLIYNAMNEERRLVMAYLRHIVTLLDG